MPDRIPLQGAPLIHLNLPSCRSTQVAPAGLRSELERKQSIENHSHSLHMTSIGQMRAQRVLVMVPMFLGWSAIWTWQVNTTNTARWEKPQRPRDSHAADAATPPAEVAADDPSLEEMLAAVLEASSNRTAKINKLWLRIMSQIVLIVYPLPAPSTLHYHTCFERARLTSRMMMRRVPTRLENRERRQTESTTKATSMLIHMRRIRTRTVQKGSCMTLERRRLQFNCLSCVSLLNIASCLF